MTDTWQSAASTYADWCGAKVVIDDNAQMVFVEITAPKLPKAAISALHALAGENGYGIKFKAVKGFKVSA